jgi:hypothetical protein
MVCIPPCTSILNQTLHIPFSIPIYSAISVFIFIYCFISPLCSFLVHRLKEPTIHFILSLYHRVGLTANRCNFFTTFFFFFFPVGVFLFNFEFEPAILRQNQSEIIRFNLNNSLVMYCFYRLYLRSHPISLPFPHFFPFIQVLFFSFWKKSKLLFSHNNLLIAYKTPLSH